MGLYRIFDDLDSAIRAWKSEQDSNNPIPPLGRTSLLAAAKNLVAALESPRTSVLEISKWPAGHAALRTALMLNVFGSWASNETKTAQGLAKQTGAEHVLIVRIMRALVGIRIFEERAEETYVHSALSRELIDPGFRTMITGMATTASLTMGKLPEYLASIDFQCPADPEKALFQYALGTKLNMFQWFEKHPEQLSAFGALNAASTKRRGPVLRAAISNLLSDEGQNLHPNMTQSKEDQILLVDIGAGHGQILGDIRQDTKGILGRMIAQDLPEVVAGRDVIEGVENIAFDFFEPQPVKGASIYFFSHIFHDWPDGTCRKILINTVPALTANFSRIVIADQVLPNTGASAISSFMDLSMMTIGGMERTERQWRELLESVGLSVVSIEQPKLSTPGVDGLIVAMLKQ